MSLDEIILIAAIFVGMVLLFIITISLISSRTNRKIQLNNTEIPFVNHHYPSQKTVINENIIYRVAEHQYQLELPFAFEIQETNSSSQEDIVKEYFLTRKRYTIMNPPYQGIKKVSNFY